MEKLYLQRASLKGFLFTVIYFSFFFLPKNNAQQIIPGADELHNDYESSYFYDLNEGDDLFSTNQVSTSSLNPNPQIPTLNSNSPVCKGEQLQLIASTIPGATYKWTGPAGFSSNLQNPIFPEMNIYKEGTYELVVVVDGCSSEPVPIEVAVNKPPRLIPTNNAAICGSDLKLFSNVSFGSPNYMYSWTGPDGYTSTSPNPVILNPTVAAEGTYVLTVTDDVGCTSSDSTSVQLYDTTPSGPIINSNYEEQVCTGAELILSTLQIVDATVNYEWYGPNGTFTSNGDYPNAPVITIPAASYSNQGWYFVIITIDGCSTFTSEDFNVGVYPQPAVNPTSLVLGSTGDCVGPDNQVRLYSNPYAGTGFFTEFYWQGPGGASYSSQNIIFNEFDASLLGDYSVIAIDDNGCESVSETMTIDFPTAPPTPVFQNGDDFAEALCPGASVSLAVDEIQASDVTYNWFFNGVPIDNNFATLNLDNLTAADAGTYSLSVSVGECPSDTTPVVINVSDPAEQPVILMTGASCVNSNFTLSIEPYSGLNVNYSWTGPSGPINSNSHTLNFNSATTADNGVYQIEVTANGCTFLSNTFELSVGEQPIMNVLPVDPVSCADGSQDISLISFPNTADPVDVLWSGPGGFTSTEQTPVLTGVNSSMSGTYTVTATNASGCISEPTTLEIVIEDIVEQPVINTNAAACAGSDLILSAQEYSGTNVTYNWVGPNGPISNNTNELILNGLATSDAGDYTLTVEIAGCQSPQGTYALAVFPPLIASVDESNIPDLFCIDGTTSLDLASNVSGGLAPYTYTWSGPVGFSSSEANPSIQNISELNAGTYNVQVIDANGCMSDALAPPANVEINIADAVQLPVINTNATACAGSDLILSAQEYSGTNVTYSWVGPNGPISNNTNELILNGLATSDAGDYMLTVEIAGCQSPQGTYALAVFPPLIASVDESNIPDLFCIDGTTSLDLASNVSGGLAPYTYTWSGPAGFSSSEANPSIQNISELNAGTYNVQVIDANGCMSDALAPPANVEINIADAVDEPVILMEGKGCSGSEVILHVDAYAGTDVTYNWVGPNGPISNNSNELILSSVEVNDSGDYYLDIQIGECASPQNAFTLTVFPPLVATVDLSNMPELFCEGDNSSLDLSAFVDGGLPPYDYSWTGPAGFTSSEPSPSIPNISEQDAGSYSIQAIDAIGCESDATADPANVEVNVGSVVQPVITSIGASCVASEVTLSVDTYSGTNVSYMWTGPNGPIDNNNNVLPLGFLNVNNTGQYSVEVIVDGCSSVSDAIALDVNQLPVVSIENSGVPCATSTSDLLLSANPSGGQAPYTYEWTGPNNFESNDQNPIIPEAGSLSTGTYSLIVIDANGCSSVATSTEVELTAAPDAPGVGGATELCEGDILQLLSDTNYPGDEISYNWTTPDGVVSTTVPFFIVNPVDTSFTGSYSLEAVVDGCTSATSVIIEVTVTATPGTPEMEGFMGVCENEPLVLTTSTTADEYQWEGPNNYNSDQEAPTVTDEMSNLESGAYSLIVFENGCVSPQATINISLNPQPSTPSLESNNDFCEGTPIELFTNNYEPGNVYTWVGPQGIDASIGNPLLVTDDASTANSTIIPAGDVAYEPGMWSLVVTNSFGCSSEFSPPVEINVLELPADPQPTNNGPLCEGQPAQLFGGSQNDVNYRWYDGDPNASPPGDLVYFEKNPIIGGLPTGTYTYWLEVERDGCVSANVVPTEIIVDTAPLLAPVSNTGPYCEGEMIQLNGPEMQGASYIWTGPDGFVSNEEDPQLDLATATNAGVYSLVVNTGFCESIPSSTEVIILPSPPMPVVENTSPACEGSSIELIATNVPSGAVVEYQWTGPDGFTSNLENPIIDNLDSIDAGAYTLSVIVDGCPSEVSLPTVVEVVELITASAIANNSTEDAPVCEGEVVALFAETIPGATYTWLGPNNFSSTLQNPIITAATLQAAGAYTLTVSVGDCETTLPDVTTVYIQEAPDAPLLLDVEPACEGSTVIMLIPEIEPWVTYTWYSALTNLPVGTGPTYILNSISMADAGQYYVIADIGGCESEPSLPIEVTVSELPNELAYAGETINLCNEFTTNLEAFYPTVGTGGWMSPTGATIITPDSNTTIITDLLEGDNVFVWSVSNGTCWNYSTDTVHVYVSVSTDEVANAGLDQNLCNEESTSLEAVPVNQSEGMWVQETTQSSLGVVITDPLDPNTTVTGMVPGNTYKFTWTLNSGYCVDFENDFVLVSIDAESDNIAYAGEDDIHCDDPVLFLDAVEPDGATGAWSTTSQASILNPLSASTEVVDLEQGTNQFIWSISTEFCQNISSDTIYIYSEGTPVAGDDIENTDMNSRIDVINLLLNDQLPSANYDFSILTAPEYGTVEILTDGVVSYQPDEDFVGMDVFEYLLCNTNCPDLCDTARVIIDVRFEDEPDLNCFIPSIITPNGDGVNDEIEINCIQHYPENELVIFNRLGDKVYSAAPYQNDWRGTYKGSPLPDGSYYYMLKLNDEARTILSGYVIIKR